MRSLSIGTLFLTAKNAKGAKGAKKTEQVFLGDLCALGVLCGKSCVKGSRP
jgi:hypothetical protein